MKLRTGTNFGNKTKKSAPTDKIVMHTCMVSTINEMQGYFGFVLFSNIQK